MARLYSECIRCQIKGNLERYPEGIYEEQKVEYMQQVLKIIADTPKDVSAPMIARDLEQLRLRMFGTKKIFEKEKVYYNQRMLEKAPDLQAKIDEAEDPLKMAIQYAMIGNYIDFASTHQVKEEELDRLLEDAKIQCPVNEVRYGEMREDLASAKKLLYLTDNCGEIVLDKLLIQLLKKRYPQLSITVMVRGEAVLNDASMEDALQVGLPDLVDVVGNGTNIAGTWLREMPEDTRRLVDEADIILAKGQGNFETMQGCGKNVYYIFLCKCQLFAQAFGVKTFTGMLVHDKDALERR